MATELYITRNSERIYLNNKQPYRSVVKCELIRDELTDDYINISLDTVSSFEFNLMDKINYEGRDYYLNVQPIGTKTGENRINYDCQFQSVKFQAQKTTLLNEDGNGNFTSSKFSFTGNISEFANLIINNLKRRDNKWELGFVPNSNVTKTIEFSNENGLLAIERVADEFGEDDTIGYYVSEENNRWYLNFKKRDEVETGLTFKYGKNNGLYEIKKERVNNDFITTRLYVYGSDEGISSDYRNGSGRLRMPESTGDYLQNTDNIARYGIIESSVIFEDVKPLVRGSISDEIGDVNENSNTVLLGLNAPFGFDPNAKDENGDYIYSVYGIKPKLHFTTGELAGKEFTIEQYFDETQTANGAVRLRILQDETGQKFPDPDGSIFQFHENDSFNLINIRPPQSVFDSAETELRSRAIEYWQKINTQATKLSLKVDPTFLLRNTIEKLDINNRITIEDDSFGISQKVNIKSYKRDCITGMYIDISVSDVVIVKRKQLIQQPVKELIQQAKNDIKKELLDDVFSEVKKVEPGEVINDPEIIDYSIYIGEDKKNIVVKIDGVQLDDSDWEYEDGYVVITNPSFKEDIDNNKNVNIFFEDDSLVFDEADLDDVAKNGNITTVKLTGSQWFEEKTEFDFLQAKDLIVNLDVGDLAKRLKIKSPAVGQTEWD